MAASAIDLTTVQNVKDWLYIDQSSGGAPVSGADDALIQLIVTSVSKLIYDLTGRDVAYDIDGNYVAGVYNGIVTFTEIFDGNGGIRLYTRNAPIQTITSIQIGTQVIPLSSGFQQPGAFIENNKRSIAIRQGGAGQFNFTNFSSFGGIGFVFGQPGIAGVGSGQIVYSAGYEEVPGDLEQAAKILAVQFYKRKDIIDILSKGDPNAGATTFRSWDMPPEVRLVVIKYSRQALI